MITSSKLGPLMLGIAMTNDSHDTAAGASTFGTGTQALSNTALVLR